MASVGDLNKWNDDALNHWLVDALAASIAIDAVEQETDELVLDGLDHVLAPAVERHLANVHATVHLLIFDPIIHYFFVQIAYL